ncbi:hypothetical protein E0Z10_g10539 [Xylaria hypoxylon]|uniref:Uncharacterized protein n=1 Tax=Xylaria hypoxylon TaxID=37992 RepID=A0A4Z0YKR2_9PEZI|nr:hypothetical protein E0Z10_g10539 [Xylaria hypoxylon]
MLRKPKGKRAGVLKVSDGDIVPALKAAGPPTPSLESPSDSITGYSTADSEDSVYSVQEDPLESWYTNVGYLPDLGEATFDVLEQVLSPFIMSSIKRKLYKTKGDRTVGLNDRNVRIDPCLLTDPFLAVFHDMKSVPESGSGVHLISLHDEVKKHHVNEWRLDLEKAIKDELEATFQRTMMMSILDRYRLMYNLKDGNQPVLDFAVQSTWNCPFMPTRALKKDKPDRQRVLSRPKPDISIAFRLRSIIEDGLLHIIPEATRRIMTYEAQDGTRTQRAFHFLMVEAKNTDKTSSDKDGQLQNLNSASQSLHCLYEFFNEADRQEVECYKPCCTSGAVTITTGDRESLPLGEDTFVGLFFKEVRVFTVVPTGTAITIRVHRACPASRPPFPSHEGRPPFQPLILSEYPLQFEFNELIRLSDNDFTRERLADTFEKIMVDYGIGRLRPLLQKAAAAIATKFYRWEEEKGRQYVLGMRHYSHGQTTPPPSAQTSRAASQATRRLSVSTTSSSPRLRPARQASSSASVDSPAAQFSFTAQAVGSQLEPPKKKIRRR